MHKIILWVFLLFAQLIGAFAMSFRDLSNSFFVKNAHGHSQKVHFTKNDQHIGLLQLDRNTIGLTQNSEVEADLVFKEGV